MWFAPVVLIAMVATAQPAAAQTRLREEFNTQQLNSALWCPCQINMDKAPILFDQDQDEPGDGTARITVDMNSLGGNECRRDAPFYECGQPLTVLNLAAGEPPSTKPEPLGPSLVEGAAAPPTIMSVNKYCTEEILQLAKAAGEENKCIQRQELRLHRSYAHPADQPYLYSLRFRMPAVIEDRTSSIRWVTAQWKQEPVSDSYDVLGKNWGPSPFLAQRFDDGVLHVTVQDEHCRCKIASAPLRPRPVSVAHSAGPISPAREEPRDIRSPRLRAAGIRACRACRPVGRPQDRGTASTVGGHRRPPRHPVHDPGSRESDVRIMGEV